MGRGRLIPALGLLMLLGSSGPASAEGDGEAAAARLRLFIGPAPGSRETLIRFDRAQLARATHAGRRFIIERFPIPDGDGLDLEVERFFVTGPNTRFVVGHPGAADEPLDFDASQVVLLRGTVAGLPQSDVFLALADGLSRGHIATGDGRPRYLVSSYSSNGVRLGVGELGLAPEASVRSAWPDVPLCGLETGGEASPPESGVPPVRGGTTLGRHQIELAIETDYELFQLFGDATSTLTYLTSLMGAVSHIYTRDANAYYQVNFIRLWTAPNDPYTQYDPLSFFASFWNANMGDVPRDVAQLISGRRDFPYGGVAYLSSLCGTSGYSVVGYLAGRLPADPLAAFTGSYDIGVVAHELGHNCSALHTPDYVPPIDQCYPPPTIYTRGEIMSYCSQTVSGADYVTDLRFTTRIGSAMKGFIGTRFCVDLDCNLNGAADYLDIAGGTSADANANGVPDECEDCNGNGVLDPADISGGTSADVDGGGVPDECEADCNANAVPDGRDISIGASADVYLNGVPDECEPDCNANGVADYNELQAFMPRDINRNLVLDQCEDCDGDGTLDAVELAGAHSCWIGSATLDVVGEYHAVTGVLTKNSEAVLSEGAQDVLVLPDGRVLVSEGALNRVAAFEPAGGAFLGYFVPAGSGGLSYAAFMTVGPGGALYVSSRGNGRVLKYDGTSGAFVGTFVPSSPNGPGDPRGLAFGPNGDLFVACGDNQVREYNGTTGAFVRILVALASNGGLDWPAGLTFKSDGNLLVAGYFSGALHEYEGTTGAPLGVFNSGGNLYNPYGLRVGPSGDVFATRYYVGRNHVTSTRIYQYDVRNGNLVRSYVVGDDTGLFGPTGFAFAPGWDRDCNVNAIPDNCDIAAGFSSDADSDGTPDECERDCNANARYDRIDIIPFGNSFDCNWNGTPDECDLSSGASQDCNANGRPDECEGDCNTNGLADGCDIAGGTSVDVIGAGGSADGIPDECQQDCNEDLVPDEQDIALGTSLDCNANIRPDECDVAGGTSPDCNANARPDECDITGGISRDCNVNARPDECDIAGGTSLDCASDGTPDECETDCNENGIEDICDLAAGTSEDCNSDSTPDECDSQSDCNNNGAQDICDIGLGTSLDCNANDRPDECELDPQSSSQTYLVPLTDLVNVTSSCGGGPFNCAPSALQGFQWTDTSSVSPKTVRIELNLGVNCHTPGAFLGSNLNGGAGPFFLSPASHCDCAPTAGAAIAINADPGDYYPGGVNVFSITNASTCLGFASRTAWGGAYARVTVTRVGDCNVNGTPDDCDIATGLSSDLDNDGLPDECEDCNGNELPDDLDISNGTSRDCNDNRTPDECETSEADCNQNGTLDGCDVASGVSNDCNGNGVPDECDITSGTSADGNSNGVADECDTQICYPLWGGFEPVPPFSSGAAVNSLDTDADGHAWDNPANTWTVANQGCPASQGKAIKGVSQTPPTTDYVNSEWFHTVGGGQLDCGAAIYTLTFDARSEAQLNPRIDWQMIIRDASNDEDVVLLHWASTQSNYAGVTGAQGGNGRGRILVKNPAGSPAFINSGFALPANNCYQVRVEISHVTGQVKLFINGILRVTTTRLETSASRMDYFRVQQVANGQASGGVNRLALDNFEFCQTGAALSWPDCNSNCQSDAAEIALGLARDCNANSIPDDCDIAGGSLLDANGNGVADGCVTGAVSRKTHASRGVQDIEIDARGRVERGTVTTEPRQGGVTELRIAFDAPPGGPGAGPVSVLSQTCASCPCDPGAQANYLASGIDPASAAIQGSELVLSFAPGLAGPATFKLQLSPTVTGFAGGSLEVRGLMGDATGNARTNAGDRSAVVGVWTGVGFGVTTDINLDGIVNSADRSLVVGQWTSATSCAP